jgi:hypothetical protein
MFSTVAALLHSVIHNGLIIRAAFIGSVPHDWLVDSAVSHGLRNGMSFDTLVFDFEQIEQVGQNLHRNIYLI